ncbi:hypothetical protein Sjap_010663 [Stephania japonica]|uniref:Uncharacterized protein n=1 Tax=Stephania japonica TaxID=461633 RepID=A0AAP0J9U8_9MAGN
METAPPPRVFLGVDVGTSSARAGRSPDLSTDVLISFHLIDLCVCLSFDQCLFDEGGKLLDSESDIAHAIHKKNVKVSEDQDDRILVVVRI